MISANEKRQTASPTVTKLDGNLVAKIPWQKIRILPTRLELVTFRLLAECSNQLSYESASAKKNVLFFAIEPNCEMISFLNISSCEDGTRDLLKNCFV